jgi:hypothetical protein
MTRRTLLPLTAVSAAFFLLAPLAHAASVSLVSSDATPAAGNPFTLTLQFAAGNDSVNAVDGSVSIPDGVTVMRVATGDSLMHLWPVGPLYVASDKKVEFTGGVPGGLGKGISGTLLTVTVVAEKEGAYRFSASGNAYKNDGTGARIALAGTGASVTAGPAGKDAAPEMPADRTPPVFTATGVGSDPALFDGKYFASFFAADADSGIDYYTVQEGWWGTPVRADRYYVLRDQSLSTSITVRAVDKAGNVAKSTIAAAHPNPYTLYIYVALAPLALAALYLIRRKRR